MAEKYFEDYWVELSRELDKFDSYDSSPDFRDRGSDPQAGGEGGSADQASQVDPKTYENLVQLQEGPAPTNDQLRSTNRQERIQAVKNFYNATPTILNASSVLSLCKSADRLYKKGLVKQANQLIDVIEKSSQNATYKLETPSVYKILKSQQDGNDKQITVTTINKDDKSAETKSFEDFQDALAVFKSE